MIFHISENYKTLCREVADLINDYIGKSERNPILVCLASGHSPIGVFQCMADDVRSGKLNLSNCLFISLDEWLGFGADDDGSCRKMMDHDFFKPLAIPEKQIVFFDGLTKTPEQDCVKINELIASHGGFDIMLVGIGMNGHIAMNEPGTSFGSYAHVSNLADETKTVGQKYFTKETKLDKGLTVGLKHFAETELPIIMASGEKKAKIVKAIIDSGPTEKIPATVAHTIDHVYFMVDKEAGQLYERPI
jgi:glucosamine-6-phosphate isomerase